MTNPDEIVRWYNQGVSERANFDNIADEVRRFMDPHGPNITTKMAEGSKRTHEIFDNVGGWGGNILAQFVQGAACNPAMKWFSLAHPDVDINRDQEVALWNNHARDQILALMRNSFYGPVGEAIHSWVFYPAGAMLVEEVPQKRTGLNIIRNTSIPYGSYVIFDGDDGRTDRFIRCIEMPAYLAVKLGNVSDDIKNAASGQGNKPTKKFEILHAIMPRENYEPKEIETDADMPWASCWIEKKSKHVIKESGYRKFPVALARYHRVAGEIWARSQAEVALADARSLNQADQKALLKWDRELDPPTLTKTGSIINGILDKRAGGNTMVRDVQAVRPLFEGSNWQAHDTMAQRKTEAVLRMFHVSDILNLLSREKPEMTAFEWNGRLQLLQQILGPVFDLLQDDFFSVIIDIYLDIMVNISRANGWGNTLLNKPPDLLEKNWNYGIVYEGPLSRAKRNDEIMSIQQTVADIAGVQPVFPEAPLMLDGNKAIKKLCEYRGTQDLLRSDTDFKVELDKLTAQQNAEKMASVVAGGAEALGKAAPGLKILKEEASGRQAA